MTDNMCLAVAAIVAIGLIMLIIAHCTTEHKPDPNDFNGLIPKDHGDGAGF